MDYQKDQILNVGIYLKSVEACNMSINNSPPLVMDVPESPERRLQIINGEGTLKYQIGVEYLKNVLSIKYLFELDYVDPSNVGGINHHRRMHNWSVTRARLDGTEGSSGNVVVGFGGNMARRPANHEESLADALEGPAADEWSFREPNHSNGVSNISIL